MNEKKSSYGIRTSLENFTQYAQIKVYPLYAIGNLIKVKDDTKPPSYCSLRHCGLGCWACRSMTRNLLIAKWLPMEIPHQVRNDVRGFDSGLAWNVHDTLVSCQRWIVGCHSECSVAEPKDLRFFGFAQDDISTHSASLSAGPAAANDKFLYSSVIQWHSNCVYVRVFSTTVPLSV